MYLHIKHNIYQKKHCNSENQIRKMEEPHFQNMRRKIKLYGPEGISICFEAANSI